MSGLDKRPESVGIKMTTFNDGYAKSMRGQQKVMLRMMRGRRSMPGPRMSGTLLEKAFPSRDGRRESYVHVCDDAERVIWSCARARRSVLA